MELPMNIVKYQLTMKGGYIAFFIEEARIL